MMRKRLLALLAFVGAGVVTAGEAVCTYEGVEIQVMAIERAKTYRDLRVDNERKQDLAIVRVSLAWSAEAKRLLVKDSALKLVDARGKQARCALKFVQSFAPPDLSPTVIEIPFRVSAGVALKALWVGKETLDLSSVTESPAPSGEPPAPPVPPQ